MAGVSISVNGHTYEVACADGEEQHIKNLATVLDAKVGELVGAIGQAGEARLLAMAGLLLADELDEAKATSGAFSESPAADLASVHEEQLIERLETLATHIENIAERVEEA